MQDQRSIRLKTGFCVLHLSPLNTKQMNRIIRDRSFRLAFLLTFIFFGTGIAFLFMGLADYSWVLFVLLPIVLGVALGAMPSRRFTLTGMLVATITFLGGMYIPGLSGLLCIAMAFPLILPFVFLGYVISYLFRRYNDIQETDRLPALLLPLIPFLIAAPLEHFVKKHKEAVIPVKTEAVFPYTPEQVYDAILSVDTLDAEKPFLMNLDLPVPTKCEVGKAEVGGIRTCHFKCGKLSRADFGGGTITEKITALERGKLLEMDVIGYDLIGRKWLGFKGADYYFEKIGADSCRLTRITTYTSVLTPRIYWEPWEKMGILQEHQYVFDNLRKDLKNGYGE